MQCHEKNIFRDPQERMRSGGKIYLAAQCKIKRVPLRFQCFISLFPTKEISVYSARPRKASDQFLFHVKSIGACTVCCGLPDPRGCVYSWVREEIPGRIGQVQVEWWGGGRGGEGEREKGGRKRERAPLFLSVITRSFVKIANQLPKIL